jgi:hypothetical protein
VGALVLFTLYMVMIHLILLISLILFELVLRLVPFVIVLEHCFEEMLLDSLILANKPLAFIN